MQKSEFGPKLKLLIEKCGTTQSELGRQIGKRCSKINSYCSGTAWPSLQTIRQIADALGIDESELEWDDQPIADLSKNRKYDVELATGDWSRCTSAEIASVLGADPEYIRQRIAALRRSGIKIEYCRYGKRNHDADVVQTEPGKIRHDDFGQTLTSLLEKNSISSRELARKCGLSEQIIYEYKSGQAWPARETLYDISQAIGVDVSELTWFDQPVNHRCGGWYDQLLISRDWSDYTAPEIAWELGAKESTIRSAISRLKAKGIDVKYKALAQSGPKKKEEKPSCGKYVPQDQCRHCGYRITDGGEMLQDACQYILIARKSRPAPVDGKCPVREESELPFGIPYGHEYGYFAKQEGKNNE